MVARRVGLYIVALCVSTTVLMLFWQLIDRFVGVVTGPAAVVLAFGQVIVFIVLTAWVFSVLAAPKPLRAGRRQPLE